MDSLREKGDSKRTEERGNGERRERTRWKREGEATAGTVVREREREKVEEMRKARLDAVGSGSGVHVVQDRDEIDVMLGCDDAPQKSPTASAPGKTPTAGMRSAFSMKADASPCGPFFASSTLGVAAWVQRMYFPSAGGRSDPSHGRIACRTADAGLNQGLTPMR